MTAALSGAVTAALDGQATTYPFGPATASGSRADQRPFFVSPPDGRTGFVRLEDLAGTPGRADWDYNDRGWRVGVRPAGGVTPGGGGPQPQGGDPTGGDPPYPPPPPPEPISDKAVLTDRFDQTATVSWTVTSPAADRMHWHYTVVSHSVNLQSPTPGGVGTFWVDGPPADFRSTKNSLSWYGDPAAPQWAHTRDNGPLLPPGAATFEFDTGWQPAALVEATAGGMGRVPSVAVGLVMGPAPKPILTVDMPEKILVNANNDNFQPIVVNGAVTNEADCWLAADKPFIPKYRNIYARKLWQDDPELLAVTVIVTHSTGGRVDASVVNPANVGKVKMWENPMKDDIFTSKALTVATPGVAQTDFVTLYAEGVHESKVLDEITFKSSFRVGDMMFPADDKKTAVVPIICDFKATPGPTDVLKSTGGVVVGMAAGKQATPGRIVALAPKASRSGPTCTLAASPRRASSYRWLRELTTVLRRASNLQAETNSTSGWRAGQRSRSATQGPPSRRTSIVSNSVTSSPTRTT